MTSSHTDHSAGPDGSDEVTEPQSAPEARQEAKTRHRILDAAVEVFIAEGPATASLESIAKGAEVSMATLLVHFADRTELMAELAGRLYLRAFPFDADPQRNDLDAFMRAYLDVHRRREVRLIWELGAQIAADRPGGPDAAYWHLVGEIELRLVGAGLDNTVAHDRSLVLTPAVMLVADRVARDLTTPEEIDEFVAAACRLGLR